MHRLFVIAMTIAVSTAVAPSLVLAQVADHFDRSRTVTIKGTVVEFAVGPGPRSYLLIETKDAAGNAEIWAVQGKSVGELMKSGWNVKEQVRLGTQLTVTVFPLKSTASLIEAPSGAPERVGAAAKARRLAHGIDVTFTDGKTLPFGPGT